MRLAIAGLVVELSIESAALRALALQRYGAFRSPSSPALALWARTSAGPTRGERVRATMRGLSAFVIRGPGAEGEVDLAAGRGEIRAPDLFPLDLALRCAVVARAVQAGGVALHAGAVEHVHVAHLFPGPSGCGKSTLAALAGGALADELVVLAPGPTGSVAHGTPWNRGVPKAVPAGFVHELAFGAPRLEPLAQARAGALLCARNLALYAEGDELARAAFHNALALGARLPAARLWFSRDRAPLFPATGRAA